MKECKHCHAQIKDECVFCTVCGGLDEQAAVSPEHSDMPQRIAQTESSNQWDPWKISAPGRNAPLYARKKANPLAPAFNILYALILFFLLVPMPWNYRQGEGFGIYGYGFRQQLGRFYALMTADKSKTLQILIGAMWILLIVAVIIAISFCITSLIYYNVSSKKKGPNMRLLRVFNLFISASMIFIFIVTIPYLTFTYMCAFTAMFYMMLITFKPDFINDFIRRKGNENRNGAAVMMVMLSIVFALCFSPIYDFKDNWHKLTSYDFYSIIFDFKQTEPKFLGVISAITLIIVALVYVYVFIQYLRGKKVYNSAPVIGLFISILLAVFIGANILVESKFGNGALSYNLRTNYYILLSVMFVVITVYFVQKAIDMRLNKKAEKAVEKTAENE